MTANRVQEFLESAREWDAILCGNTANSLQPPRVATNEQEVYFELDFPGWKREQIDVEVDGDELRIQLIPETESSAEEKHWIVRERQASQPEMHFKLPFRIDPDFAKVEFSEGVLSISLQKPATELPRKLEIHAAN